MCMYPYTCTMASGICTALVQGGTIPYTSKAKACTIVYIGWHLKGFLVSGRGPLGAVCTYTIHWCFDLSVNYAI